MTRAAWSTLLDAARAAHATHAALHGFTPFPDDVIPQDVQPFHIAAADLMAADPGLRDDPDPFVQAFLAAVPLARWRETYKETDIGEDFLARFACYCLIGPGGAFWSDRMHSYVVYMPAGLHYRWHHHPGEELYLVLHGQAEFFRAGARGVTLGPGGTSQHASNEPHAMTTHAHSVLAYVVWRSHLGTPPVLTGRADAP